MFVIWKEVIEMIILWIKLLRCFWIIELFIGLFFFIGRIYFLVEFFEVVNDVMDVKESWWNEKFFV